MQLSEESGQMLSSLLKYKKIGILTHSNPDPDALGSCFAMQMILGKERCDVVLEFGLTRPLFAEFGAVVLAGDDLHYDALLVLDAHQSKRLGLLEEFVENFARDIFIIDHHRVGECKIPTMAELIDPTAVSTGILVFELCSSFTLHWDEEAREKFARAIYYTILGDTDGFQNRNIDARCFSVCAELVKFGLKAGLAFEKFYCQKSLNDFKYMAEIYESIQEFEQGKIVFAFSSLELQNRLGYVYRGLPQMMGELKKSANYEIIVIFKEREDNLYKLSFRSKSIDVQSVCKKYGGGGHLLASGCEIAGSLEDTKRQILEVCKSLL